MFAINFVEIVGSNSIKHQLVTPLWNSNVDTDEVGNCYIINESEGDSTVQSSALTSCTVRVISANGVTISLKTPSQNGPMGLNNLVLYFERVDIANNCTSHKYGMVIKQNETCHVMFQHTNLLFSLQGSGSLQVQAIRENTSRDSCVDVNPGIHQSNLTHCNVQEYSKQILCSFGTFLHDDWLKEFIDIWSVCRVDIQSNCTLILSHREAVIQCLRFKEYVVSIMYSTNSTILDVSGNNISQVTANAFTGLYNLIGLFLGMNNIRFLEKELFNDLNGLIFLDISNNKITYLSQSVFNGLVGLKYFTIRNNNLQSLPTDLFHDLRSLERLDVGKNSIQHFDKLWMANMRKLLVLVLNYNKIISLPVNLLSGLNKLLVLNLNFNKLISLEPYSFQDLQRLVKLSITNNDIKELQANIFQGLVRLQILFIRFNRIASLNFEVFSDTPSLLVIDLSGNRLREIHSIINPILHVNLLDLRHNYLTEVSKNSFANLSILTEVLVNQQEICECYIHTHVNCTATEERSPYLTCERLLSNQGLAVMIWIIGVNALVGNGFVLVLKQISIKTSKVQDIFLTNLALPDLLMGVYMLIIASADVYFREYFPMQGELDMLPSQTAYPAGFETSTPD